MVGRVADLTEGRESASFRAARGPFDGDNGIAEGDDAFNEVTAFVENGKDPVGVITVARLAGD